MERYATRTEGIGSGTPHTAERAVLIAIRRNTLHYPRVNKPEDTRGRNFMQGFLG